MANAASVTDNMAVSATVVASCSVAASPLGFGNYDPVASSALDVATTIVVTCTNGTTYTIGLDAGTGSGATVAARKMTGASSTLTYSIYRNAGRTQVWGQTIGVDTVAGTGTGAAQSLDVYGRAPAHQTAIAGGYSDTVVVTLNY